MKVWAISIVISIAVLAVGIWGAAHFIAQDACLESGGTWKGFSEGCIGADTYSYFVIPPFSIALAFFIVAGLSWIMTKIISKFSAKT
ncbi:hypothetical protein [uncultured Alcanivorax sp.]|jgi:hypothetical protein|uniref:hypothetical protein n=1 Tax=uncultured Alcanivorax sp. TaxID=191215 RepID=UPI0025E77AFB|nr:hypothetical protein [uncultured Alcanivorax sp.]